MTTFPPTRKASTSLLSKGLFIIMLEVSGIVKVLDIISSIPLRSIFSLVYEIFDGQAPTFPYCTFVQKVIDFEGLVFVIITLYKHRGGLL